jgi:surface protein
MERFIIWLDPAIYGEENKSYFKELMSYNNYVVRVKTVEEAMNEIYNIIFQDVFIIVSGSLFPQFYNEFKANLYRICIVPKIVIFTSNGNEFIDSLGNGKNIIGDKFYNIGGVKNNLDQIKQFIKDYSKKKNISPIKIDEENFLNFDYIDTKEKLVLPLFYKYLIKFKEQDNQFYNFLHKNYYNKSDEITHLLDSINNLSDIPIEILSKYYVRIYTENSEFYKDLNQSLREGKRDNYLSYIKVLYEGIKLKALPYSSDDTLYRGAKLSNKEISKIIDVTKKGEVNGLPGAIVFSKTFLSFSKNINVAKAFMEHNQIEKFSKVLFILKSDIDIDYNSSTHVDVGRLSLLDDEEEVLFLPFSSFKIEKIEKEKDIYKIELKYLAKYYKIYEKDFKTFSSNIPESEFKKEIFESKLIKIEKNASIHPKKLIDEYNSHKIDVKLNSSNRFSTRKSQYIIRRIRLKDKDKFDHLFPPDPIHDKNCITGYLFITNNELNQDIRIINSFEESKRRYNYIKVNNELALNNENEIKNKCEIEINGLKLKRFAYCVTFREPGKYDINYKFKSKLRKADYMFAGCTKLEHLDLKDFYSKDVNNMSCMFMQCTSLKSINISNLDTLNVNDMSGMFYECESLTNLDLNSFNTQNVESMSLLFFGCKSLVNINLSRFNTKNVKNMYSMFCGCISLRQLNLLNFYTRNVNNMTHMFSDCKSL